MAAVGLQPSAEVERAPLALVVAPVALSVLGALSAVGVAGEWLQAGKNHPDLIRHDRLSLHHLPRHRKNYLYRPFKYTLLS